MKKKVLAAMLTAAVAAQTFAGSMPVLAAEEGSVESLEVWYDGSEAVNDAMVSFFENYESVSGVKLTYTRMDLDSIHDKVIAAAAAGNTPDLVFGLPEWISEFNAMGITTDLNSYVESWEDKEQFYENVMDTMMVDGKYVALPWSSAVRALLVHDTINETAGAEVPATWDDVLALEGYRDAAGAYPYGLTCTTARAPQELLVYLAQYGLEICSASENGGYRNTWQENEEELEKATKVFQFYKDLVAKGLVDPSSPTYGWEETDANFASGLTGMFTTGTWMYTYKENYPDTMADVSIHEIPAPADGKTCTYLEPKPLFVFDRGDKARTDAAFEAAAYLVSKDFISTCFSDQSPRKDVEGKDQWTEGFNKLKENAVAFPPVVLSNITQAMTDSLAKALQDNMDAKEVAVWLSDAVNASLQDSGEYGE